MRLSASRGLAAAAAALVVALTFAAAPAYAGPTTGSLFISLPSPGTLVVPAHGATPRTVAVDVDATGPFTHAVLTFDLSGLAGVATATFAPAQNCTVSGTSVSCPIPDVSDQNQHNSEYLISLRSTAGAADGATGSFDVTASSPSLGSPSNTLTQPVAVKDASQLAASTAEIPDQHVSPGAHISLPTALANVGSEPAPGVELVFELSHSVVPATYDNCLYAPWAAIDGTFVACTFPGAVAAGEQVKLATAFQATVPADSSNFARADMYLSETTATVPTAPSNPEFDGATFTARPASGTSLALVDEPFDGSITGDGGWSSGLTWGFQVDTAYDLAATGANVSGHVGDTVVAHVAVTDNGPAVIDHWSSHDEVIDLWFTTPGWADVVTVPTFCRGTNDLHQGPNGSQPGMLIYECTVLGDYYQPVGQAISFDFGLKIKATKGSDGTVAVRYPEFVDPVDTNHANDTATVTLGGATTSPSPSPSATSTAHPSPSATTPTGTPTTTAPVTTPTTSGGGSVLAHTGARIGVFGGAGLVLFGLGALLVIAARRRRSISE